MTNPCVQDSWQTAPDRIAGMPLKDLCPELAAQIAAGRNTITGTVYGTQPERKILPPKSAAGEKYGRDGT
jgi:hypothetical protein